MLYEYKIIAHEENGHFWSSCPDIPEAHSAGDSLEELIENAVEGITLALSIYVGRKQEIPHSSGKGDHPISLPAMTVAKIILWNQMVMQNMSKADLAERLGISPTAAGRLVDFEHASKMESVENALSLFNLRLQVVQGRKFAAGGHQNVRKGIDA
ncbi:type II toxin-antitoxin system HicB family antitoxin [Pseudomonas aeruginosa]|uniref:type II toxin-antitoxin system HicB family antitoxin n=1 Tax=Pseudomonas aeruginosa TaxID=287 RepID=UPI000DEFCADC|nr:type II toxin-antitoxin system HicB family antitoxin [Pseudomonas aeruginosa]